MQDFNHYRGKKVDETVKILTGLGYNVNIQENAERPLDNSEDLVVSISETGDKQLKIISGKFKFLTKN